ncbi:hypothetical protein H0O07_03820 [Campylobacter jejuni]|uniref:hypothetical protein n=1 Tax=Campylobacter jejuni TaxID=197 RepID=UPI001C9B70BC|nr:hypothetical protein [Campylobacter jejuni]MBY7061856.1 hypothetical protein [Campylobacter jejuni]MBY7067331.1 hypothetical protein [Campylobacter jejuni]MBY7072696.1 hypothetical protein [Campylobacter jejuni]MBY7074290.1 hypothetical protein [Campylobacter jejuni]MBY7075883.1 hypothetical protein [Campylobacter jejuni]
MLELITQKDQDFLQNIENLDEEYIQKFINKKISEIAIAIETAAENADKAKDRTQKAKNLNTDSDGKLIYQFLDVGLEKHQKKKKKLNPI